MPTTHKYSDLPPSPVALRLLEFHVADHCNLRCQGCSHFSPSSPRRSRSLGDVQREVDAASRGLDPEFVHILGGEPLLNPELKDLLPLFRRAFPAATIKVVTNGLLVLRQSAMLLPALAAQEIALAVSIYPGLIVDRVRISAACASTGVPVEYWEQDTFLDFLDAEGRSDPAEARRACPMGDALNIREDRLYPCPVTAWADLGGGSVVTDDGVPLTAPGQQLREVLSLNRTTSKCRHCRPKPPRVAHSQGNRSPFFSAWQ